MKGAAMAASGCAALILLVLCVPLLLLTGAGTTAADSNTSVSLAAAPTVPSGGASCADAVGCQAVPTELPFVPRGFFPDRFTTPSGECTSWAAALWPGHRGRGVTWGGDAWEWLVNAVATGYSTSDTPSMGAIAVFDRTAGDRGAWGHVAVVLTAEGDSFRITEMNWVGPFVVDERTVPLSAPGLVGFIPVPQDASP